ncbi:MAG: Txe/YoeB family addiction module toxin [Bacilli bacterium]|nr:Txe/YoeB family addiction module toxin [Bacilli bacterium]
MVKYDIYFSKQANKDKKLIANVGLQKKVEEILEIIEKDQYDTSNNFERLKYDLKKFYSRRISYQHRLVYEVDNDKREITIHRMWSHYENYKNIS